MIATNKTFALFLSRRPQIRSAHGVFEKVLIYLRTLKNYCILFGEFNNDTLLMIMNNINMLICYLLTNLRYKTTFQQESPAQQSHVWKMH